LSVTNLDEIFFPRSAAVIGSSNNDFFTWAMLGGKLRGQVQLVNPNYPEVLGQKCYASILDIPGPVDYAVIAVPSRLVLSTVRDCIEKGLKAVHLYTSGFSETGTEEGIKLQEQLAALAKGKIRLVGPNCMGIYCPKSGLCFNPLASYREGNVGVITQSGTFAQFFIQAEKPRDIRISKLISYGNAVDLDSPELLDYLGDDPDTAVIALYVEGINDGRPLLEALQRATAKKPVIALKGGITQQGGRVAHSHTGALAGAGTVWETMFRQAGVLLVDDFEALLDTVLGFSKTRPPAGRGVSIITYSGGFSVVQSDMCARAGLEVPQFSQRAMQELRKIVPAAGTMVGNPLDAWQVFQRTKQGQGALDEVVKIIADESQIHSIVLQMDNLRYLARVWGENFKENFDAFTKIVLDGCRYTRDERGKLILLSIHMDPFSDDNMERAVYLDFKKRCEADGFAVYPSLKTALGAAANMYKYKVLSRK